MMKYSEGAAAKDKIISLKRADKVWTTVLNTLTTIPSKSFVIIMQHFARRCNKFVFFKRKE